ncbi:hypothetical protein D3C72_2127700 [compost metagenome]
MELNQIEREIMRDLLQRSGEPLLRSNYPASGTSGRISRNVDVAVRRLRAKAAEQLSARIPIKSLRGIGYIFVHEGVS